MKPQESGRLVFMYFGLLLAVTSQIGAAEPLFVAEPVTMPGEFTGGIEGPACDADGNVFAVNFGKQQTIGRISSAGQGAVYLRLPGDSVGNGIRFGQDGAMYIADYVGHNIYRVASGEREPIVFAHDDRMNQPNDLAIGPDGTLYASDPNWGKGTGQLWRIDTNGEVHRLAHDIGTTNGIELSPDGKRLYVNESVQRNIWRFDITEERLLENKQLLIDFPDFGFDGMRCDVHGNLYVTRYGKGVVAIVTPEGKVTREIDVLGKRPSNLCFGGADGRTVYVTEVEHTRLVKFRVEHPGLAWQRWQEAKH